MLTCQILESLSFIWYVTRHWLCNIHFCGHVEVIWGRIFSHSEVNWPPMYIKCWQVNYWSPYFLFDMSLDIGYKTIILVVMEVIWGRIFGHSEAKWPPIDIKCWQVNYWSPYLSFDIDNNFGGHGGHMSSHLRSLGGQMTTYGYLIYTDKLLRSLPFV